MFSEYLLLVNTSGLTLNIFGILKVAFSLFDLPKRLQVMRLGDYNVGAGASVQRRSVQQRELDRPGVVSFGNRAARRAEGAIEVCRNGRQRSNLD